MILEAGLALTIFSHHLRKYGYIAGDVRRRLYPRNTHISNYGISYLTDHPCRISYSHTGCLYGTSMKISYCCCKSSL